MKRVGGLRRAKRKPSGHVIKLRRGGKGGRPPPRPTHAAATPAPPSTANKSPPRAGSESQADRFAAPARALPLARPGACCLGHKQLVSDSTYVGRSRPRVRFRRLGKQPLFCRHDGDLMTLALGTLAFVIAIIEVLYRKEQNLKMLDSFGQRPLTRALYAAYALCSKRELAKQIHDVLSTFLPQSEEHTPRLKHALYIGGSTTLAEDRASFAAHGPDIIVGTPGRLEE
ncbi:MAG: hypothetical protein BJ554DRAFT_1369, partial [Olpidium bornovanus]